MSLTFVADTQSSMHLHVKGNLPTMRLISDQLAKSYEMKGIRKLMILIWQCVDDSVAPTLVLTNEKSAKSIDKQILEHLLVIEGPPATRIEELHTDDMEIDKADVQAEDAHEEETHHNNGDDEKDGEEG